MIVEQGPGIAESLRFAEKRAEADDKIITVFVIGKDVGLRNAANNDVLQQAGHIKAGRGTLPQTT